MLSYCLECRQNPESSNPKLGRTVNRRLILLSKCKKMKFIKEQEVKALLGNFLGAKVPLSCAILLVNTLF